MYCGYAHQAIRVNVAGLEIFLGTYTGREVLSQLVP